MSVRSDSPLASDILVDPLLSLLIWSWQAHEDWASLWRQGLGPRKLPDRLIVTPSWCEGDADEMAGEHAVVVVINPGRSTPTVSGDLAGSQWSRPVVSRYQSVSASCGHGASTGPALGLLATTLRAVPAWATLRRPALIPRCPGPLGGSRTLVTEY